MDRSKALRHKNFKKYKTIQSVANKKHKEKTIGYFLMPFLGKIE